MKPTYISYTKMFKINYQKWGFHQTVKNKIIY
jgi:hypothetical protein